MSVTEEYQMVLDKLNDYKRHGHLQLRFSLSNPETAIRLKDEGFTVIPVKIHGDLVYDVVAPK